MTAIAPLTLPKRGFSLDGKRFRRIVCRGKPMKVANTSRFSPRGQSTHAPSNGIVCKNPLCALLTALILTSVTASADARPFKLSFQAIAGSTYQIQATEDLNHWATLGATNCVSDGPILFDVTETTNAVCQLYRVQQEIQSAEIPVFQFAIFYNSLLEFTWAAPLTVRGRVHANGSIYTGSLCDLTFMAPVTASGTHREEGLGWLLP